ncbi:MAG TPA: GntR family transcriptional regulator [Acidimicrobiia bacterium]|nr:GntR family transcriptional regulator [Acidimicrobiia bacterium]
MTTNENAEPIVRPATTHAAVTEYLRDRILSGVLRPGSRILQAEVAAEVGTSTTPVREALRQLVSEGLLVGDPHRGMTVHQTSLTELVEMYEIRLALEPLLMASTVQRITDGDLERVSRLAIEMDDETDLTRYTRLNAQFHRTLANAANKPRIAAILANLRDLSTLYMAQFVRDGSDWDWIAAHNRDHKALVVACQVRDIDAAQEAERTHLSRNLEAAEIFLTTHATVVEA